jgi:allophanate hydrolase
MDRTAFEIGHAALGTHSGSASIEIGPGGLSLECLEGQVAVAVTGGDFLVSVDGLQRPSWCVVHLRSGSALAVQPGRWGNWCYIAFAGKLEWPKWLGSQSTFPALPVTGKLLETHDLLTVNNPAPLSPSERGLPIPIFSRTRHTIDVVIDPQERFFEKTALDQLFSETYFLSTDYNRMAVRLDGPTLPLSTKLDMISEGVAKGSIQVPGTGLPFVLLADHQPTGGYPKIATTISAHLDAFAQLRPRQPVRFRAVTVEDAVARARTRQMALRKYTEQLR